MTDEAQLDAGNATVTVDELVVRAEISDLLQRYVRGIDRVDMSLVESCYHPDAWDDHNQFRGTPAEFVAWLDGRLERHAATTHFLSTPLVRRTEPNVAQAQTSCVVHQVSQPDAEGRRTIAVEGLRYLDRFERRSGPWLIAHRRVALDWRYYLTVGHESGQPFEADWLVGRRDGTDASYADVPNPPEIT